MRMGRRYTVSDVAKLAHVTVRTLHHYDEIGLLVPSARSKAGYRLYDETELARLRDILLFRALGFGLDAIAQLLDDPEADRRSALLAHRQRLLSELRRTEAVVRAVDAALLEIDSGERKETNDMFEGFDELDPSQYDNEVRERWGDTEAYRESKRRTARYSAQDWTRMKEELDAVMRDFASLATAGRPADGVEAMDAAERHRRHIDRWFYPCDHAMHLALTRGYVEDPRFRAFFDRYAPDLADYVAAAIGANARRTAE